MTLKQLGNRLRALRLEKGVTQEQFAEKVGIGYKYYQQIESGSKKQIWLSTVDRLAEAHSLECWELLKDL